MKERVTLGLSGDVECVSIPLHYIGDKEFSCVFINGSEAEIDFTDQVLEKSLVLFRSRHK